MTAYITALVVTSIAAPNAVLRALSVGCEAHGWWFVVVGDSKSPSNFHLDGCDYYSLDRQRSTGLRYANLCPVGHYARKNIGYLLAMRHGASIIVDTDDDNMPRNDFWWARQPHCASPTVKKAGWVNVYRYFTDANVWPRGLPLRYIRAETPSWESLPKQMYYCPIQQGLANQDPDTDAVYRLVQYTPVVFQQDRSVTLEENVWCPFNSQNTVWWKDAFALLYLPATCSFRMTDIWRSFVAQRIAWANGWRVSFHSPTVLQERNEHDLMRDFVDEVPGYLHNELICSTLETLLIKPGIDAICDNLIVCYEALVKIGVVGSDEIPLLRAWIKDAKGLV